MIGFIDPRFHCTIATGVNHPQILILFFTDLLTFISQWISTNFSQKFKDLEDMMV